MPDDKTTAYNNGWEAYWKGAERIANPYDETTELYDEWMAGWMTAQAVNNNGL